MQKLLISLSIFFTVIVFSSLCWGKSEVDEKHFITLKENLLSIEAQEVSAESIFKDLGVVCGIKIVVNDNSFPKSLVSVRFGNVPLEKAVKRILKITGAKNYLVHYQESGKTYRISEIEFLGGKGESQILTTGRKIPVQQTKVVPETPQKKTTTGLAVHDEEDLEEKIEEIEEKFEWDDDKTAELVKEVLRSAPPQIRRGAIKSLTDTINNSLKKRDEKVVDREMVYEAFVEAVPPNLPGVREKVKQYLDAMDK